MDEADRHVTSHAEQSDEREKAKTRQIWHFSFSSCHGGRHPTVTAQLLSNAFILG